MNSIYTAYILSPRNNLCGREFLYQYSYLPDDTNTDKFIKWISPKCSKICKNITEKENSEWVFRSFMAAKMILAASLDAQAFTYCQKVNMRLAIHHLQYNALQYCCRALILSNSFQIKNLSEIIEDTHKSIINKSVDILSRFNKDFSLNVKKMFEILKDSREILTYKAPSSGDKIFEKIDIIPILKTICELAQLESEIFEQAYTKNVRENFLLNIKDAPNGLYTYKCADGTIVDQEDWYRIDYIRRKFPRPMSIRLYMTEGWIEDFFGSWINSEPKDEYGFNPDDDWRIIFDLP